MNLTIVTITKNNLQDLKKTIKSVELQNTPRDLFEHLIIDGNSQDGTVPFLKETKKFFISEEDSGIYDAFNKGIRNSHGDYIAFLNSGDVFADFEVINSYLNAIDSKKLIYWFNNVHMNSSGKIIRKTIVPKWAVTKLKIMPPHQSTLICRSFFNNNYYDSSLRIAGDYDFFLKNYKVFLEGNYINAVTINQFTGGISNNGFKSILKGNKEAYSSLRKYTKYPLFYMFLKLTYKFFLRCKNLIF